MKCKKSVVNTRNLSQFYLIGNDKLIVVKLVFPHKHASMGRF